MSGKTLSRRKFMAGAAAGVASTAVLPAVSIGATTGGKRRPNIVFILADDLGYFDLGCYGQKVAKTPNIDALAKEGMRFTNCYAGSTVCAPSRSCFLTGQHTGHTRVRWNTGLNKPEIPAPGGRVPLLPGDFTIAEMLKKQGYATGVFGKWGLGEPGSTGVPNKKGFDEWFGYLNQKEAHSYYPTYLWNNEERYEIPGNADGKRTVYSHDLFEQRTLDFIKRHKDEPFFLFASWTLPHGKHEVPDFGSFAEKDWPDKMKAYGAMIERLDSDVGKITALLKELKIDSSTVVYFASDNGASSRWEGYFDSCGPFREFKGSLYDGGLRVPIIVRHPGVVPGGVVSDVPWYFADIMPTLAATVRTAPPPGIDGIDMLPVLTGKKQTIPERFFYWETHHKVTKQAVRWGKWKAVRHDPLGKLELYDLTKDPGETDDIAASNPAVVARIEKYLKTARTESISFPLRYAKAPEAPDSTKVPGKPAQ